MAKLNVIYSPKYLQYSFGEGHPFWPERAKKFLEKLAESELEYEVTEPKPATDEDILLAHAVEYLERVKKLAENKGALSVDTPLNKEILEAAYLSVGGTIKALELSLAGKPAVNLLGGLHHAERNDASGFCVFCDHAVAIKKLRAQGKINQALILDIDVHAGNGTQDIFYDDPSVFNISLHQDPSTLYPGTGFETQTGEGAGKGYTLNKVLPPGAGESEYLEALDEALIEAEEFDYDVSVLVFGADTYLGDPLAGLQLEMDTYARIGQRIKKLDNLAILCAGGYSKAVPDIWLKFIQAYLA